MNSNTTGTVYDKPITNVTVHDQKLKTFPVTSRQGGYSLRCVG